jgi:glutathione S-transferase
MRLFTTVLPLPFGPNPRVVRMVLAEKGLKLDLLNVDIVKGENRQGPYLSVNPAGEVPALQLDDGRILAESVAIAEYIDELHPEPPLLGRTPEERALTRMWIRRADFRVCQPLTHGFRAAEGLAMFKDRVHCIPQAADDLKATVREGVAWLETQIGDKPYLCGDEVRLADILLYCFLDFGAKMNQPMPEGAPKMSAWMARMAARPSAQAVDEPAPAFADA